MRLMASCNQVAQILLIFWCDLGQERFESGAHIRPCVLRMAGVTTAGLYFVRFLLSAMVAASPTSDDTLMTLV